MGHACPRMLSPRANRAGEKTPLAHRPAYELCHDPDRSHDRPAHSRRDEDHDAARPARYARHPGPAGVQAAAHQAASAPRKQRWSYYRAGLPRLSESATILTPTRRSFVTATGQGGRQPRDDEVAGIGAIQQSTVDRAASAGGFRCPWVSNHAGEARWRCWSGRRETAPARLSDSRDAEVLPRAGASQIHRAIGRRAMRPPVARRSLRNRPCPLIGSNIGRGREASARAGSGGRLGASFQHGLPSAAGDRHV